MGHYPCSEGLHRRSTRRKRGWRLSKRANFFAFLNRNRQERVRFISRDVAEVRPDRRTCWSVNAANRVGYWCVRPSFARRLLPIPIRALPHTLRGNCPKMPAGLRKATPSLQDTSSEHRRADG